jgi:hypothetical protein
LLAAQRSILQTDADMAAARHGFRDQRPDIGGKARDRQPGGTAAGRSNRFGCTPST